MKRSFVVTILSLFITFAGKAQTSTDVDLAVNKFQSQYNNKQYEDIFNSFSEKIKKMMTVEKTRSTMEDLNKQFGEMKAYTFNVQQGQFRNYKVTFANSVQTLVVSLDKDKKIEAFRFIPYTEVSAPADPSNFIYKSPTGNISGTLVTPDGDKKIPVVLFVAGSGPTDRNCNQEGLKSNAFKMLADSLRNAGIASVRYDKRGVGQSVDALKDEAGLRFDDMVNDAIGFIKMLKADKRFSSVIVLGHSEGSLVGMIAAGREQTQGYISVAGLGEKADKIIVRQLAAQSEELSLKAAFILDSMSKGHEVDNIDPALTSLFRSSIQPYIRSWIKYDPQQEIRKLNCPVLILQGTTDLQVPVEEAELLKAASPKATLKVITGMNHILKQAPEDRAQNMATYNTPELPLSPGLMPAIINFVAASKK